MNKWRIAMGITILALSVVMAACKSNEPAADANGGTGSTAAGATTAGTAGGAANTTPATAAGKPAKGMGKL